MMVKTAYFITEITILDPDTQAPVYVALYKDNESGGVFGIDSSYILTLSEDDLVIEPFNGESTLLIEPKERA